MAALGTQRYAEPSPLSRRNLRSRRIHHVLEEEALTVWQRDELCKSKSAKRWKVSCFSTPTFSSGAVDTAKWP
jgi:hypothetical protein